MTNVTVEYMFPNSLMYALLTPWCSNDLSTAVKETESKASSYLFSSHCLVLTLLELQTLFLQNKAEFHPCSYEFSFFFLFWYQQLPLKFLPAFLLHSAYVHTQGVTEFDRQILDDGSSEKNNENFLKTHFS